MLMYTISECTPLQLFFRPNCRFVLFNGRNSTDALKYQNKPTTNAFISESIFMLFLFFLKTQAIDKKINKRKQKKIHFFRKFLFQMPWFQGIVCVCACVCVCVCSFQMFRYKFIRQTHWKTLRMRQKHTHRPEYANTVQRAQCTWGSNTKKRTWICERGSVTQHGKENSVKKE